MASYPVNGSSFINQFEYTNTSIPGDATIPRAVALAPQTPGYFSPVSSNAKYRTDFAYEPRRQ